MLENKHSRVRGAQHARRAAVLEWLAAVNSQNPARTVNEVLVRTIDLPVGTTLESDAAEIRTHPAEAGRSWSGRARPPSAKNTTTASAAKVRGGNIGYVVPIDDGSHSSKSRPNAAAQVHKKLVRSQRRREGERQQRRARREALEQYPVQTDTGSTRAIQSATARPGMQTRAQADDMHASNGTGAGNTTAFADRSPNRLSSPPKDPMKKRSNKQLMRNAIVHTCLAGPVNKDAKENVLAGLDAADSIHFVILLHDPNDLKFRAIYSYDLVSSSFCAQK